jgi:hypothetical protein
VVATRSRPAILIAVASLVAGALLLVGAAPSQAVPGALSFPGSGFGPIPDGGSSCGTSPGAARDVTFEVTGMPRGRPSDVRVTGLALTHPRVGEVVALLIAPTGRQQPLFGRTGVPPSTESGDNSDLAGPYSFADDAPGNWWASAGATDNATAVPPGAYRASSLGATASAGAVTGLTSGFSDVENTNGTWILRLTDVCSADSGAVTAATLELAPTCAPQEAAVGTGHARVATANAAVSAAGAAAAAADTAGQEAAAALTKATKAVAKAKKALKKARQSGDADKTRAAKQKLGKVKKALKAAKAADAAAQQTAAVGHQRLTSAQAAAVAAQGELPAAESALAACRATLEER